MIRILSLMCCLMGLFTGQVLAAGDENAMRHIGKNFTVYTLSEGQSTGSQDLLLGTDPLMLRKYLPEGTYPTAVNAFLVRGPEQLILVDTGFGRELFANLERLGVRPDDIDVVLLTHMHGDHIGGLLRNGKPAFSKARVLLSRQEHDYWMDKGLMQSAPQGKRGGFAAAQKTLAAYEGRVSTFLPDALEGEPHDLLTGIVALSAFGHTPGHTMYRVHDGDEQLLIWGDLTHAMAIQMPVPTVALTYDVDPEAAVASRMQVLRHVSDKRIPVAGMHIPAPGMGSVSASPDGGYAFK